MNTRVGRFGFFALACCALLAFASCQIEDPPEAQTLVRVKLNASMTRYQRVLVELFARSDSDKVVAVLWNDKLQAPESQIPAYDVKNVGGNEFIVKVRGFVSGDRLAMQTRIFYSPTATVVRHDDVPALVPQNWLRALLPSVGELSPGFQQDTLSYIVKLPQGNDSIYFTPFAATPEANIQVNGQTVLTGKPSKTFRLGSSPDTAWFRVTDTSTITSATREYRVTMIPTLPPGLLLSKLVPSVGRFNVEFTPENNTYILIMPRESDTVSFIASPLDPATMQMSIDNKAFIADKKSQVFTLAFGEKMDVDIYVIQGSKRGLYRINVDHTYSNSH